MVIRCVQQVRRGEQIKLKHHWVPLDSMSIYMPVAVMASEDQRFRDHRGFDFKEIRNAVAERASGKRIAEEAPSPSRQPRMCFFGHRAPGCARVLKRILPS